MTFVPYRKRYKDFLRLDPATGCLEWAGYIDKAGYGRVRYDGESGYVHRYAWEQEVGPVTEGLLLRHSCDNPKCANIEHLSEGTHEDNAADRDSRGRSGTVTHGGYAKGSNWYNLKEQHRNYGDRATFLAAKRSLTKESVTYARAAHASGLSYVGIAKTLGVEPATIGRLVRGETYKNM